MKRLEELCHISSGGTPSRKKPEFFGGNILWAKISDIENAESGIIVDTEEKITEAGLANIRNKVFPKGTLLFAMYASIGKVAFAGQEMSCNQAILGINPKRKNEVYLPYLKVWFEQNKRKLTQDGRGGVFKNLSATIIRNTKVDLPPYPDQIRISEVLSKIERLISQRKESINLLNELLKSTFLEMFGDPARNDKGLPIEPISKFGVCSTGNTPSRKVKEYYSDAFIEWIKTDNILEDSLYVSQSKEHLSESGANISRTLEKNALLVTCIAGSLKSIGRAGLTDRAVAFNQQINAIQPFENVSSIFLYWLFKVGRSYIQNHASKGMKKILSKGDFEKIKLPKPEYTDQKRFENIALQVEILMQKFKLSLSELDNLYNSLSQRAFKGDLDLSKVPIPAKFDITDNIETSVAGSLEPSKEDEGPSDYKPIEKQPKTIRVGKAIMENFYEEDIAQLLKEYFGKFDFNFNEVIELFENEKGVALNYLTSEELKRNRKQLEQDVKTFIFSCVEGKNSHLKLKQWFFNAFDDLELKTLNPRLGRERLLDEINESSGMLELEDVAGIYFKIEE